MFYCQFIALFLVISIVSSNYLELPYADWAHTHVVWYNNTQNQKTILQMAQNYMKYQIPFGGFNIDSGWATCYNDFIWNKNLFYDPQGLINYFHSHNIKVMLWATSVINTNCPNYKQAQSKGYFLNNGKTVHWWHGNGSFIDFFNPEATKWWKSQMDKALDMGIDAWKCDGTDPMTALLRPWPYSPYKKRFIKIKDYSHLYYGTFYNYTKQRNPNALIMARPVDSFHAKLFWSYAPKYVMFSGWVGDQDATPEGLAAALSNVMHSAWKGYLSFGFDIGGYRGNKNKVSKNLFLRWAQVGSVVPFMENGGNGLHEPWAFDQQTIDIYRKFVLIHHDLKSFFLTAGSQAYIKSKSIIEPLAQKRSSIQLTQLETFGYKLWQTFLIFPIFEDNSIADMQVPEGHWIYYFNHSYILDQRVQARVFPLNEFPIFIKKGAIYPIEREYLDLQYMSEFKLSNKDLSLNEIVMVYLDQGNYSRVFYHRDYTDYLTAHYQNQSMIIKLERYHKANQFQQTLSKITIRVIGVLETKNLSIKQACMPKELAGKSNKQIEIGFQYDQKQENDLLFQIDIGKQYLLTSFKFKEVKISE